MRLVAAGRRDGERRVRPVTGALVAAGVAAPIDLLGCSPASQSFRQFPWKTSAVLDYPWKAAYLHPAGFTLEPPTKGAQ
jgi:hypothetical protein